MDLSAFSLKLYCSCSRTCLGECVRACVCACVCVCVHVACINYTSCSLPISSDEEGGPAIQVGFVTYDKVLHFYNVKVSTQCIHVHIVGQQTVSAHGQCTSTIRVRTSSITCGSPG